MGIFLLPTDTIYPFAIHTYLCWILCLRHSVIISAGNLLSDIFRWHTLISTTYKLMADISSEWPSNIFTGRTKANCDHHHVGRNSPTSSLTSNVVVDLLQIGILPAWYLSNIQWSEICKIRDTTGTYAPIVVCIDHKARTEVDTTSLSDIISSRQE